MRIDYTKVLAETKESVAGTNSAARFSIKTCQEKEKASDELSNYKSVENPTAKY